MAGDFAKLFTVDGAQVLFIIRNGEDGWEIRMFFDPQIDDLDVCEIAHLYKDDYDKARNKFDGITTRIAREHYSASVKMLTSAMPAKEATDAADDS